MTLASKNQPASAGDIRDSGPIPGLGRSPGDGREWQPTSVFLPGKAQGQRSLAGYTPCGHKVSDTTDHKHEIPKGNKLLDITAKKNPKISVRIKSATKPMSSAAT